MIIPSYSPKQEIINLTEPVKPLLPGMEGKVALPKEELLVRKMERVSQILSENPPLYQDDEVRSRVLKMTRGNAHPSIRALRKELQFRLCCSEQKGTYLVIKKRLLVSEGEMASIMQACRQQKGVLMEDKLTLSEAQLTEFTAEKFWELIEEFKVKKLIILSANSSKNYESTLLEQLAKKNVPLLDLIQEIAVEFAEGEQLKETKAKLRLCGAYFESLLDRWTTFNDKVTLKDVSLQTFWKALTAIESGQFIESDPELEYLQFQSSLPEGLLGKEAWATWGDVGPIPAPPQWLLDAYDKNNHVAFYMPPKIDGKWVTINSIGEIAKARHGISYDYIWDKIVTEIGDKHGPEEGYWCLRSKVLPYATRSMIFDEQMKCLAANYPDYREPLTIEAIVSEFLYHVASGKTECLLGRSPLSYTRCQEVVDDGIRVVVGGLSPSGLGVDRSNVGAYDCVGVLPLRK